MRKTKVAIALILWLISSYIYVQNFQFLENLNNKFTDILFELRGVQKPSQDIVIVDIDEDSLKFMKGFDREKLASIIDNLREEKVAVIGLDIAFPQEDQTSPKTVLSRLGFDAQNVKDYDSILADTFKKTFLVSGYAFDFSSTSVKGKVPNISSIIMQQNYDGQVYLPQAKGIISNISLLQDSSYSSGFFNMIADEDGVTRSLPLIIKYKDELYPSLALEMVRVYWRKKSITLNYSTAGISDISLDDFKIPTDRFGRLIVNYKNSSKSYKYISAYKIYNGSFDFTSLKDKIVLIGSSISRFYELRATPYDSTFPAIEIQANVIDNIINSDFLTRPTSIEILDIFILFIILMFLVSFNSAIKNTIFSMVIISGFAIFAFFLFDSYGVVLNILFPLSASFTIYTILTSFKYINEVKSKEKINKKLIVEMQSRQNVIEKEVTKKTYELQKVVEEKTVLLRELHHRVKNNLQLILSIANLQKYELKDEKVNEEFTKLQNRIKSIAKTHEILCDNDDISNVDMSVYIGELCEEIQSGLMQSNIDINVNAEATLSLRQAVYVGLVINEIISNSIKYAFDQDGGEINIYLEKLKNEYVLKISDDGTCSEENTVKSGSLGLKLVEALVINQLDGSIQVKSEDRFGYIIKFKASNE